MTDLKRSSLVKPTTDTPFHIDFDWWKSHDNNWRIYLLGFLCSEHQAMFSGINTDILVDWVDPKTAEVRSVDGIQHMLMNHCAKQPDFLTSNTTLVDAVFRVLLARGNEKITPSELSEITNKPADIILRTLTGAQVYKGIRPIPK